MPLPPVGGFHDLESFTMELSEFTELASDAKQGSVEVSSRRVVIKMPEFLRMECILL